MPHLSISKVDRISELPLVENGTITIGRSSKNDVVLASNRVSREHCVIEIDEGTTLVRDLGSRYGTTVNGASVDEPVTLRPGDRLGVAGFEIVYVAPAIPRIGDLDLEAGAEPEAGGEPTAIVEERSAWEQARRELSRQVDDLTRTLAEVTRERDDEGRLRGEAADRAEEAETRVTEFAAEREVAEARAADLAQEHDAASARAAEIERERDAANARAAEIEGERDTARTSAAEHEAERDAAHARATEAEGERDAAQSRAAEIESDRDDARARIADLEADGDELRQRLGDTESGLASAQKDVEHRDKKLTAASALAASLRDTLAQLEGQRDVAVARSIGAEQAHALLRAHAERVSEVADRIVRLQAHLEPLEAQWFETDDAMDDADENDPTALAAIVAERETLAAALEEVHAARDAALAELDDASAALSALVGVPSAPTTAPVVAPRAGRRWFRP